MREGAWLAIHCRGNDLNTSGAEVPGDGDATTQDLGSIGNNGVENLWALGDLPENLSAVGQQIDFSSVELDNFLNSRTGGFATLMIVGADRTDLELLFATKEAGIGIDGPTLDFEAETAPLPLRQVEYLNRGVIAMRK